MVHPASPDDRGSAEGLPETRGTWGGDSFTNITGIFCKTFCDNRVILSHVLLKTDHTFERCKEAWCAPPCPAWSPACPTTSTLPAPAGSRAPGPPSAWQGIAHCCTIFLKSSGYRNIDDRHRNPNINIREIIWLGNQLLPLSSLLSNLLKVGHRTPELVLSFFFGQKPFFKLG